MTNRPNTVYICPNWHAGARPNCGVCGANILPEWDQSAVEADLANVVGLVVMGLTDMEIGVTDSEHDVARDLNCHVDGDPAGDGLPVYIGYNRSDGEWSLYGWVEATDPDTGEQLALAQTDVEFVRG